MIRNQKLERSRKRKESKAKVVKSQTSSAVSREGGTNSTGPSKEPLVAPQAELKQPSSLEPMRAPDVSYARDAEPPDNNALHSGALAREATASFASSSGVHTDSRANGSLGAEQSQTSYSSFLQQQELQQKAQSNGNGIGIGEEQSSGYQSGSLQNKRLSSSSLAPLDSGAQSYKWAAGGSGRRSPSAANAGREEPYQQHSHSSAVELEPQTVLVRPTNGSTHSPYAENTTPTLTDADAGYARPVDRVIARADQILRDSARGAAPDKLSARKAHRADARDPAAAIDSSKKVRRVPRVTHLISSPSACDFRLACRALAPAVRVQCLSPSRVCTGVILSRLAFIIAHTHIIT